MLEPLPSSKDPGVESKVYESQVEDDSDTHRHSPAFRSQLA